MAASGIPENVCLRLVYVAFDLSTDRSDRWHNRRAKAESDVRSGYEKYRRERPQEPPPHMEIPEGASSPDGNGKPNVRGLIIQRASEVTIEKIEWLWPGRIAIGKQTLIAGEAGLGKSQTLNAIAATVTTGGLWPCGEGRAPLGSVLLLCAEDAASDTIVPRLMAAGAVLERVHIINAVRAGNGKDRSAFNLQTDLLLLEQLIREIGDVRLVGIDPISSYLGPKIDSYVNASVRSVLEPVGEMAARMRVAVASITHPPKGAGRAAIDRFIGSVAFVAASRTAFMVAKDAEDKDRRLFLPVKTNIAALGKGLAFRLVQEVVGPPDKGIVASSVAWEHQHVSVSADEALRAVEDSSDRSALDEAKEFLRDKLAFGAVVVREIEEHANAKGISKATLKRARTALKVVPVKEGMDGPWSLKLPEEVRQAEEAHHDR